MTKFNPFEIQMAQFAIEINANRNALQYYSNQPIANPNIIEKRTNSINRLIDIYNGIDHELNKINLVYPLAISINKLLEKDPEIGVIQIKLRLRQNNNQALIDFNPFE